MNIRRKSNKKLKSKHLCCVMTFCLDAYFILCYGCRRQDDRLMSEQLYFIYNKKYKNEGLFRMSLFGLLKLWRNKIRMEKPKFATFLVFNL